MKFKIKGVEYWIPDTVKEIPLSRYLKMQTSENLKEQIQILAGIPDDVEIDEYSLLVLTSSLDYIHGVIDFTQPYFEPQDIYLLPYGVFHFSHMAITNFEIYEAMPLVISYYNSSHDWTNPHIRPSRHEAMQEYYANAPAWKYYPLCVEYINQINAAVKTWSNALKNKVSNPNPVKGANMLDKFGVTGALMNLAGEDLQKYNYIYGQRLIDVLTLFNIKTTKQDITFMNTPKIKKK
jgi:hypothetical protein